MWSAGVMFWSLLSNGEPLRRIERNQPLAGTFQIIDKLKEHSTKIQEFFECCLEVDQEKQNTVDEALVEVSKW